MSLAALQDLLRRTREKATGVWKLGQEPGRTIFFDYGDTVFAQSTHLQDRLTYILVERGKITQAQMDHALANLKPGLSIGKNLIEMGFITQRDLLEVAKGQVERIICGSLATPDLEPVFEAHELDASVVRLPLNTAQVLLTGILALKDREGLLELLGPLNQVVVLQGKGLMDLTLPPDLAKLPPLLDGTHTLLELSRESQAEPVRLGAFALFLREMGWARLHEMPPLDRHALDLAFSPEPEPLSPPLPAPVPEPFPETVPSLFATIQDAGRPTTNLEHLSSALDQVAPLPQDLPEAPEPLELPDFPHETLGIEEELQFPWAQPAATGQADLLTPPLPLPPLELPEAALAPAEPAEPRVLLRVPPDAAPQAPPEAGDADPEPGGASPWVKGLGALLLVAILAGAALLYQRHRRRRSPRPLPVAQAVPAPAPAPPQPLETPQPAPESLPSGAVPEAKPETRAEPEPEPKKPEPKKPEPKKPEPKKPEPRKPEPRKPEPKKPAPSPEPRTSKGAPVKAGTASERLAAISKGDFALALKQGQAHVKSLPKGHYTLRLEIACQGDTVRRVADVFKGESPDLFLLPMKLRDGRPCYQVFCGSYASLEAAEKKMKHLPAPFRGPGNRPKTFRIADLPKVQ